MLPSDEPFSHECMWSYKLLMHAALSYLATSPLSHSAARMATAPLACYCTQTRFGPNQCKRTPTMRMTILFHRCLHNRIKPVSAVHAHGNDTEKLSRGCECEALGPSPSAVVLALEELGRKDSLLSPKKRKPVSVLCLQHSDCLLLAQGPKQLNRQSGQPRELPPPERLNFTVLHCQTDTLSVWRYAQRYIL
jgi:hypothetical protein